MKKDEMSKYYKEVLEKISNAPALPDVAGGGKWPECQRYESATGEIFNVRLVNKSENKIVYTRSDVDLNGIFTVTLSEWLADLGEQRGAIDEALNELKLLALDKDYRADSFTLQPLRNALLGAGEQRGEMPDCPTCNGCGVVGPRMIAEEPCCDRGGSGKRPSQEVQPLPARPKMRSGDMASHYAIDETNAYMNYLEAELSRLSSPIFKSFSHMIGEILDCIDMAPNDDPIPYIRKYVNGLRKSHLTDLRKD